MRTRYKISLIVVGVIVGIIVGLPLVYLASFQINQILEKSSIPEESFSLISVPKSKHLEFLTSQSWRTHPNPPPMSLFDDHTFYSYFPDGTFLDQGVSDYTIPANLGVFKIIPLSENSGLLFTVNKNKVPQVKPYEIHGNNNMIIGFSYLGGLGTLREIHGEPPIQYLKLLNDDNIENFIPTWFGITGKSWTIVTPEQEEFRQHHPFEIEFSENGVYNMKYSDGCKSKGLFGIIEGFPIGRIHVLQPEEECTSHDYNHGNKYMPIMLKEDQLCLNGVEYSSNLEKTATKDSLQCNSLIDIVYNFDNTGNASQIVESILDAYLSKDIETCDNLPDSENQSPTNSDWKNYCKALIESEPSLCNSISKNTSMSLERKCLENLEKILISNENSYEMCYEQFGTFYTSGDEIRNCFLKFDLTEAPEFYQKLNACVKLNYDSGRSKCLFELALESDEKKVCTILRNQYPVATYGIPNCLAYLNDEEIDRTRVNGEYGIKVSPGETKEIVLHCNTDEYAIKSYAEVQSGDVKLTKNDLVVYDPEKIRGETWIGKTTLEVEAVNNDDVTGRFLSVLHCKKISSEPIDKQISLGIPEDKIQCKEFYELIFNSTDGSPACVKQY
jgi:hypothetical protein